MSDYKNKLIVIKLKNLYKDDPVDRLRGTNIVRVLQERGWHIELYQAQKKMDIVVFLDSLHIDKHINARYKVLDIQDNHLNPQNPATLFMKRHIKRGILYKVEKELQKGLLSFIKKIFSKTVHAGKYTEDIKSADYLICSSLALKEYYGKYNANTCYIPDAVEVYACRDKVASSFPADGKERVSLCWVGTANNIVYLKIVENVLKKLQETYRISFSVICSKKIFSDSVLKSVLEEFSFDFTFIEWEKNRVFDVIQKHDIAIAPLPGGVEKSTNKILTYMALQVATVCSGAKDYEMLYDSYPGSFSFVENNDKAWFEVLERMITDKKYREKVAQNGYLLSRKFSLEHVADQYEKLFHDILKEGKNGN